MKASTYLFDELAHEAQRLGLDGYEPRQLGPDDPDLSGWKRIGAFSSSKPHATATP